MIQMAKSYPEMDVDILLAAPEGIATRYIDVWYDSC